jgi:hypothetical protein
MNTKNRRVFGQKSTADLHVLLNEHGHLSLGVLHDTLILRLNPFNQFTDCVRRQIGRDRGKNSNRFEYSSKSLGHNHNKGRRYYLLES